MTAPSLVLSFALLALVALCRPPRARCPAGFDLRTGIRRDGRFACWPHPVGDPEWDGTFERPERGRQPGGVLESQIWCTNGTEPIVVDERTVGCQRGGYR